MTTQVQTVNQAAIHKLAAEIAVQTNGKDNLTEFKKAAKDVLTCCEQLLKQAKEHKAAEEKTIPTSTPTTSTSSSDSVPTVTTAELRRALAKLVAAYIKSTGETGKVLFGSGSKNRGIVGAEMTMGFSSANEAKSAMESQATGMIVSGCFSIAAGCMAVGGGAMGAGAAGSAASSLTELNAAPEVAEASESTTAATGEASTASDTVGGLDEIEMTPVKNSGDPTSEDPSAKPDKIEARLEERTGNTDSASDTNNTNEKVEGKVEQSEKSYTKAEKEQEREQIRLKKEGKQSKAQALTMGTGLAQGLGSITQSHFTQQQATQDQASKTLQTAAQAVNTSTQTAQKFYGDIQSGVQAVAQTMDLVNQTVVASSRV